jgi:hypothetical protein
MSHPTYSQLLLRNRVTRDTFASFAGKVGALQFSSPQDYGHKVMELEAMIDLLLTQADQQFNSESGQFPTEKLSKWLNQKLSKALYDTRDIEDEAIAIYTQSEPVSVAHAVPPSPSAVAVGQGGINAIIRRIARFTADGGDYGGGTAEINSIAKTRKLITLALFCIAVYNIYMLESIPTLPAYSISLVSLLFIAWFFTQLTHNINRKFA